MKTVAGHLAPSADAYRLALDAFRLPPFAASATSGPSVVALEGPNGAGKTTLCHNLARSLGAPSCLGTDEAWFSDSFKTRMIRDAEWHSSAMFFLSGCFEQMRLLQPRPERLVVMDRSLWSTLAVHAAESPERLEKLLAMLCPISTAVRVPDLTIVLEASFATCQSRIAKKAGTARALDELTATADFHSREREFYRWLARHTPNMVFLDAERGSPDEVADSALVLVREKLRC
ncbi:MAG TPA: deoxynucleoside kinase [Candidatus Acidoferrum sp.]|jgi:thymidylate kinase|nr:deoxynucleoside kinase [Candidatus Acidoferrum sp.]